ncbi:alkaline phosphatase D family protein [Marinibactrum halimedae]|uniref:Alkaline phosphatase n=1 Tax=Marinibactrum halimedae TaxID=1444977 RepID=A0AA37TAN6_9GAMM|nr:alkaline phosphatase D family protein [Marinibactrum halimedae]MCD9461087.1 alkaline phosphatase D family protein [Marinibactrum halimedae]GLS25737.1 alkaline phosphatase [Marinibactrum halimedae]
MAFTRRLFSKSAVALGAAASTTASMSHARGFFPWKKKDLIAFNHGVASGDPLQDRVILWTRITLADDIPSYIKVPVRYRVAKDPHFRRVVCRGYTFTKQSQDFTVKIDPNGLQPNTTYYYQFECFGNCSPIGRTKTLPKGHVDQLKLATVSCSNYPYGYFNVYGMIAQRDDLDAVLHLGDYIYEYANGEYGDGTEKDRIPEPNREIVSLEDYRQRYAQYRTDPNLQEAHRQHPFITVWDDHESTNDSWTGGAENHNPELGEGDWGERKSASVRAYYEWMPIRLTDKNDPSRIYRRFQFGDLMDLIMLDTRLYGRDQQIDNIDDANDESRTLLGEAQFNWFTDQLSDSHQQGNRWRLVGQQVMMGQFQIGGAPFNFDQWDGYAAERGRIFDYLSGNGIDNTAILTGDIHTSWGMDLTRDPYNSDTYNAETGEGSVAVEFVTPAVSSPGVEDPVQAEQTAQLLLATNPHMKFVELFRRGYVVLDITHERLQGHWFHAETIDEENNYNQTLAMSLQTVSGENRLTPIDMSENMPPNNQSTSISPSSLAPDINMPFSEKEWLSSEL